MEERFKNIKIAVTGPESTGKTTISKQLANHYSGLYIPEYARDYILNLNRKYEYRDLEHIAKVQMESYIKANKENSSLIFFDTWLIITKVWFQEVYGKCPKEVLSAIQNYKIDLYLICAPDIEWVKDEVRENGGEKRVELFNLYIKEIESLNIAYKIIEGSEDVRFKNAVNALEFFLENESLNIGYHRNA